MKLSFRSLAISVSFLAVVAGLGGCADTPEGNVYVAFEGGTSRAIDNGQSIVITVAITNDSGQGATWSCSGTACGAASDLASQSPTTAKFTATVIGTATITATSVKNSSIKNTLTITVTGPPSLIGAVLAAATKGTAYNQSLGETGGAGTLTFSVTSGSLPGGLTLNGASGVISGIPTGTTTGQFTFTVKVTDSGSPSISGSAQFSITVQLPVGALQITTASPLPSGSVGTAYNATISATGGVSPYTFSVDSGGTQLPAGLTISNNANQGVISGTPTTSGTFTNILVDVHDSQTPTANTSQMTFSLTISPAPLVITPGSGTLPNATQGVMYTENITATGGVPHYTFSLDPSSAALPAGLTFTGSATEGTISGTPTTVGTTTGIIVDVKDSSPGAIAVQLTYSLTVSSACGTGSESLLNGQYAMLVKGFDNGAGSGEGGTPQPIMMGAVLYVNGTDGNGTVAAGTFDINSATTHGVQETGVSGTFQMGSDQRGCMTLTTSSGTPQTFNFRISVAGINSGVASTVHIVDFDAAGPFVSGVMLQQDTSAFTTPLTGNYAFELASPQNSANGGKVAAAGVLTLAYTTGGMVTGGELDMNDAGQLDGTSTAWSSATPLTVGSGGTYFVSTANGIGNVIFPVTINGVAGNVVCQIYIVSANEILIMSGADETQTGNIFGGGVLLLQTNATFSDSSLSGTSVLHESGLQTSPSVGTTLIGTLTTNGSGTANLYGWQNSGTAIQNQTWAGTAQVAANGRVIFLTGGGTNPPLFWLVANNEGFYLGADASAESGFFEPQTSTAVTTGTPYAFGSVDPELAGTDQEVGVATFTGGNLSGTTDNSLSGTLAPDTAFGPLTYSVDGTGLGSIPSGCMIATSGSCQQIFYIISPTKGVWMNLLNGQGHVTGSPNLIANQ
jgi:hypothetical protein